HSTLSSIQALLAPSNTPPTQLLRERADANTRLAQTLGLTNTFVDPDPQVHVDFVRRSHGLLKDVQASGWSRFRDICGEATRQTLDHYSSAKAGKELAFDGFIQVVVLGTILNGLLNPGRDMDSDLDTPSLSLVTTSINDLWTLSKTDAPPPPHLFQQLHDHLRQLIPPSTGIPNPIDFVVPTWETMWRVCATTIARAQGADEYKDLFHDFLQTDTLTTQHFAAAGSRGFSVKDFIEEVMRLHPPSKHISRLRDQNDTAIVAGHIHPLNIFGRLLAWIRGTQTPTHIVRNVADIETVLRVQTIWSDDAHLFEPRRHQASSPEMREVKKLVFGHGSLRCVAASWAPLAAAIISATIIEECEEAGWEVISGPKIGGRLGWEGWKV
ncbi:hypothetical protein P691DRAFT_618935, partial [Macrolepiota fuliginosa MF-IS2]